MPETGCWLWNNCIMHKGYGLLVYKGKTTRAHRLAYKLSTGIDPGNNHVLHKCDTRSCVNPDHLYLGSNDDNIRDKVTKGRSLAGTRNPSVKLTVDHVESIRKDTRAQRTIAKEYGVSQSAVHYIKVGKTWR